MTISAVNCHYSITGSGPPLFLTHGIGAAEDAWRFMLPTLAKYFTVVTYDLRGHGKSPVSHKNFTLDDLFPFDDSSKSECNLAIYSGVFKSSCKGLITSSCNSSGLTFSN